MSIPLIRLSTAAFLVLGCSLSFGQKIKNTATTKSKHTEIPNDKIEGDRDLSKFVRGGSHNFGTWVAAQIWPEEDRDRIITDINAVKEFIWTNWEQKRRAYISFSISSVDAVSESHLFIEPNPTGTWQISWRCARHTGRIDDLPSVFELRKERPKNGQKTKAGYFLLFFDKNNKIAFRL